MNKNDENAALSGEYLMNTYSRTASIVRGKGCRVWGPDGSVSLDFTAGISVHNVGHSHPKVVEAIQRQAEELIHCSNLFYTPNQGALARKLSELGLGGKVFFVNSGAEANEAMIKLARLYGSKTGRYEIICMKNSFHGRTLGTLSATGQGKIQVGYDPLLLGFEFADFNDLDSVKALVNERTVGILVEAIQGEGGIIPASDEFLKGIRALCDEKDLMMLCDEIQCGMGRTGKWFGFEHVGVKPDACTMSKSLADGLPLGALLASPEFSDVFTPGSHGSTFGGNPVSCAASLAVLEVMEEEKLIEKSTESGTLFMEGLQQFIEQYDEVLAVRGKGLMIGMIMKGSAKDVVDELRDGGLLACTAGEHVVRFLPPLCVTEKDLEEGLEMIADTFEIMFGEDNEETEEEAVTLEEARG